MPNMRRRKFIKHNDTHGKESKYNDELSQTENKNKALLGVNSSTSTILETESNENPVKASSDITTTVKPHQGKRKYETDKVKHIVEKPIIQKIKIRNSKHKTFTFERSSNLKTVGSCTDKSREETKDNFYDDTADKDKDKVQGPKTFCKAICRICHGGDSISEFGQLVSACSCKGTIGRIHVVCLETWLTESGKSRCELCSTNYSIRRVHKYGILRGLTMWLFSQNSKQLIFDMLGTMLMMPLAILAAWLSGTTLLNLMAQDDEMAAWPLVSSFMLSCTTLVCYYCWIVSTATRHAISWWIWYQSQYEVKLLHTILQADDSHISE